MTDLRDRREYLKAYRQANRERLAIADSKRYKRYYEANRERIIERTAAYQKEHPDERRTRTAAWMRAHPGERLAANVRYRARKAAVAALPYTTEQLAAKLAYWGGKCWICRKHDHQHWDHVKPISKGGPDCLSNLRPACASCNSRKRDRWPYEVAA